VHLGRVTPAHGSADAGLGVPEVAGHTERRAVVGVGARRRELGAESGEAEVEARLAELLPVPFALVLEAEPRAGLELAQDREANCCRPGTA
jgi:hypothetical protein